MILETGVHIGGTGKIDKLEVHDGGVVIDKSVDGKPENIWVEGDVKIKIGDDTHNGGDDYLDKKPGGDASGKNPTTGSSMILDGLSQSVQKVGGGTNDDGGEGGGTGSIPSGDTSGTLSIGTGTITGGGGGSSPGIETP